MPEEMTFLEDEHLLHVFPELKAMKSFVRSDDPIPGLMVAWAAQLMIPFRQLKEGTYHKAIYEDFVSRPESEFARLFSFWEKDQPDGNLLRSLVKRHSSSALRNVASNISANAPLTQGVKAEHLQAMTEILDISGLSHLYGPKGRYDLDGSLNS